MRLRRPAGTPAMMVECFVHCLAPNCYSATNVRARPEARLVEIMIQSFFQYDHAFFRDQGDDEAQQEQEQDCPFSVHLRELRSLETTPRPGPGELRSFSWQGSTLPPTWTDQDVHEANVRAAASPDDDSFFMCVNGKVLRWTTDASLHPTAVAEPTQAASSAQHSSELAKVLMRAITEAPGDDDGGGADNNNNDGESDATRPRRRPPPAKSSSSSLSRSSQASMLSILEVAERSATGVDYETFACRSHYDPRFGVERSARAMKSEQRGILEHGLVSSPFGRFFEMVAIAARRRGGRYGGRRRGDDGKAGHRDGGHGGGGDGSAEFMDGGDGKVKAEIDAVD